MATTWLALGVLSVSLLLGCGSKSTAGGTDGSTHWLSGCSSDDDCSSGLSCICNTCTVDCSSDATCDTRSSGGAPECLALTCSGSGGTNVSACGIGCDDDEQCGSGTECINGACLAAVGGTPSTNTPSGVNGQPSLASPTPATSSRPLGAACLPGDEYDADFPGFSPYEVALAETQQCQSQLCLVNYFQGRVTCPDGYDGEGQTSCLVPGTDELLMRPVAPQLEARPPADAVYCSCRCDGPVDADDYCECGDGLECTPLIDFPMPGTEAIVGSYCTKPGTVPATPDDIAGIVCQNGSCGDASEFTPEALGVTQTTSQSNIARATAVWLDQVVTNDGCISRHLPMVSDAEPELGVSCMLLEAKVSEEPCDGATRASVTPDIRAALLDALRASAQCSSDAGCERFQVCEVPQLTAESDPAAFESCTEDAEAEGDGWCLVEANTGVESEGPLAQCERRLRFIGAGIQPDDTSRYLGCVGPTW